MTSSVGRRMPRVHDVVLPLLREAFPDVQVTTWVPDVGQRKYPLLNVRRVSGLANPKKPDRLDLPVVELTAYDNRDLATTENLLLDGMYVLWDAVNRQRTTPAGYLHSYFTTMGPTQFQSNYEDTWRIQSLIQLGLRPPAD